jgi:hypothetical protein
MADRRNAMASQWFDLLGDRLATPTIPRHIIERELRLFLEVLGEMVGPMRREVKEIWHHVCEHYGRVAAARGLAAGEVVEEIQFAREVLTRQLAPVVAPLRARQAMAIMIHMNSVLDRGIAAAVVGYTDALVATLFAQNGVPAPESELDPADIERQLDTIEGELAAVVKLRR